MSTLLTENFTREVEQIYRYGGSANETFIRIAFQNLLNNYCKQKGFLLIPELAFKTQAGKSVNPDRTVKDASKVFAIATPKTARNDEMLFKNAEREGFEPSIPPKNL